MRVALLGQYGMSVPRHGLLKVVLLTGRKIGCLHHCSSLMFMPRCLRRCCWPKRGTEWGDRFRLRACPPCVTGDRSPTRPSILELILGKAYLPAYQ